MSTKPAPPSYRYKPRGLPRLGGRVLVPLGRNKVAANMTGSGTIQVTVALTADELSLRDHSGAARIIWNRQSRAALRWVVRDVFRASLSDEVTKVVEAYRLALRESLPKGDMPELKAAMNKARLQELILANVEMADSWQACALLGLPDTKPEATLGGLEWQDRMLRFTVDGRDAYPVFQFDVDNRRIYPAVSTMLLARPRSWTHFRLLHWLVTPHLDFAGSPGGTLAKRPEDVLAAFYRETHAQMHG